MNQVVAFLNSALDQDEETVNKMLLNISIHADQEMIDHPTVQVTMDGRLRLIGLLNGLVSDRENVIQMLMNEQDDRILGFRVAKIKTKDGISRVTE